MMSVLMVSPLMADEQDEVLEGPALLEPVQPSSDLLMQRVRELLPRDPIAIDGLLRTRKRKGSINSRKRVYAISESS